RSAQLRHHYPISNYFDCCSGGAIHFNCEFLLLTCRRRNVVAHLGLLARRFAAKRDARPIWTVRLDERMPAANSLQNGGLGELTRVHHSCWCADMAIAARSGIVIIATANPGNAIAGIQTLLPERNAGESGLD